MATHSNILAWRTPWTEEPGGLQSMGLQESDMTEWLTHIPLTMLMGLPGGSDSKEFACNAGNLGSILGLQRSPGEWNGNQLQYSYLENSMDKGAWGVTVHRVAKRQDWVTSTYTVTCVHSSNRYSIHVSWMSNALYTFTCQKDHYLILMLLWNCKKANIFIQLWLRAEIPTRKTSDTTAF